MRSPLTAVLISTALVVSAMGIWPTGVESARATMADTGAAFDPATRVIHSAEKEEYRYPAPSSGSRVGFYPYRRLAGGIIDYRWWNGKRFVGPRMDATTKEAYDALVAMGVTPETFKTLSSLFGGGVDGLYVAIFILAVYLSSEPTRPTSLPSPSPSPSPGEGSITLPPNYRFVWHFGGDTFGAFDGTLSGDPSGWHYSSTAVCKCISTWHCTKDDGTKVGTATCDFAGALKAPDPKNPKPHDISCTVKWSLPDRPTWTSADGKGYIYPVHDQESGALLHFEFEGDGQYNDGEKWHYVKQLLLEPKEKGSGCE